MKKVILALALLTSASAFAQHHGHHHHGYWQRGNNGWMWVAPTIIGGIIGYEIVQNQGLPPYQQCSPWTEIQNPDGTITRTRTCNQ